MGWLVMAVGLTILIITGSYQNQKMSETTNAQQYASASVWASQILMIANRINDIRYVSGQQDGVISSDKLALPVLRTPELNISYNRGVCGYGCLNNPVLLKLCVQKVVVLH